MDSNKKKYPNVSVLVFGASGRQALPICKGFYDLGCKVTVYCRSKADTGYLTKYAHARILFKTDTHNLDEFLNIGA